MGSTRSSTTWTISSRSGPATLRMLKTCFDCRPDVHPPWIASLPTQCEGPVLTLGFFGIEFSFFNFSVTVHGIDMDVIHGLRQSVFPPVSVYLATIRLLHIDCMGFSGPHVGHAPGPLFLTSTGSPLTQALVNHWLWSSFSSYSFQIRAATSVASAGVPDHLINARPLVQLGVPTLQSYSTPPDVFTSVARGSLLPFGGEFAGLESLQLEGWHGRGVSQLRKNTKFEP